MNELALFAGGGGGLLGSVLCGWRTAAAVELDLRCREILFARQVDGCLDRFPVWDDVRTFDGRPWRGRIGLITGGFPCQPFSTASRGRKRAVDLWPDMRRIVCEVQPGRVLAENVQREPVERAAHDLARLGFHCLVLRAPAAAVGAPHRRDRWWVAADTDPKAHVVFAEHAEMAGLRARARSVWAEHPTSDHDVADGLARGVDRYESAVGNGQVPQVVHAIAELLGWAA